jgi:hypothetical protein
MPVFIYTRVAQADQERVGRIMAEAQSILANPDSSEFLRAVAAQFVRTQKQPLTDVSGASGADDCATAP